ncbi:MAG: hypothetical protein K9K64_04655 [Desulfohalobiaceae bacterium]|nr:hypothetical protein [Desulfohalobiaceae bacterium]
MKKTSSISILIVIILYFAVPPCFGSFIIHLKNGREFVTNQYWEEGDQVKFFRYGGEVGVARDLISGIEEEKGVLLKERETEWPADSLPQDEPPADGPAREAANATTAATPDKAGVMQEKKRLVQERGRLVSAFRQAKTAGKKEEKDRYWQELLDVQESISGLRKQVLENNQGKLPGWWND